MNYLILIFFIDRETDIQRGEVICPGSHSQGLRDPKGCVLVLSSGVRLVPDPRGAPNVWQDKSAPQGVQRNAHSRAHRLTRTHTPPPPWQCSAVRAPAWFPAPAPRQRDWLRVSSSSTGSPRPPWSQVSQATSSPKVPPFLRAGSEGEGLRLGQRRGKGHKLGSFPM